MAGSELEIHRVAAAFSRAASIRIRLLTCAQGLSTDEAITRGHRAGGRCRAIGRILGVFAGFFATAGGIAAHVRTNRTDTFICATIRGLTCVERVLRSLAHCRKVARGGILHEARVIGGDQVRTFHRKIGDLLGAHRIAIAAARQIAIERFVFMASIRAILHGIAGTRTARRAAAARRCRRALIHFAAARKAEERADDEKHETHRRKRKGCFHGADDTAPI